MQPCLVGVVVGTAATTASLPIDTKAATVFVLRLTMRIVWQLLAGGKGCAESAAVVTATDMPSDLDENRVCI